VIVILLYCYIVILLIFSFKQYLKLANSKNPAGQPAGLKLFSSPSSSFSTSSLSADLSAETLVEAETSTKADTSSTLVLITTGDVIPARSVNYKMTKYNDFTHPFIKTADFLKNADITLINLEAPLIKDCSITNEGMVFCGNQRFIEGLKFADIDVVNLANNHALNYGIEGLQQTTDLLENNHILISGFPPNNMTIKQFNPAPGSAGQAISLGFLGWNLLEQFNKEEILTTIRQAKTKTDLLIVSLHWGEEYSSCPAKWQISLAHQIIDNGADLIVGNHPHWIQPTEIYNDKLIIYSHGNFIFDQEWSQETKIGIVAKHIFINKQYQSSQFSPVLISDYNQPAFLEGKEKETILKKLKPDFFASKCGIPK